MPSLTYNALVIRPASMTSTSSISKNSCRLFWMAVALTRTMFFAAKESMIVFALAVLWECSSSIMIMNSVPLRCASVIRSNRFLRSQSRIAVLPFLVTSSQLMKVVLLGTKPFSNASNRFCVARPEANLRIFSRLCSSKSPFPGQSQMKAVLALTLARYLST